MRRGLRSPVRWGKIAGLIVLLLGLGGTGPARAYYDDTHYSLTFYLARCVGFTPAQAYRIASANVSIDYDPETEPSRYGETVMDLYGLENRAQRPRVRFHAMLDSERFQNLYDNSDPARAQSQLLAARAAVKAQRDHLWRDGLTMGNPGVFLHFLQDETPHAGYPSWGGHWISHRAFEAGLPLGPNTDILSWSRQDPGSAQASHRHTAMIQQTLGYLQRFLLATSGNKQKRKCDWSGEVMKALAGLMAANHAPRALAEPPVPKPLWPNPFQFFSAERKHIWRQNRSLGSFAAAVQERINQLAFGPNMNMANAVIAFRLRQWKEIPRFGSMGLPDTHRQYDLNHLGFPDKTNRNSRHLFRLHASIKARFRKSSGPGGKVLAPLKLAVMLDPTRSGEKPIEIASVTVSGGSHLFEKIPVGIIHLELSHRGKLLKRRRHVLLRDGKVMDFVLPREESREKPPAEPSDQGLPMAEPPPLGPVGREGGEAPPAAGPGAADRETESRTRFGEASPAGIARDARAALASCQLFRAEELFARLPEGSPERAAMIREARNFAQSEQAFFEARDQTQALGDQGRYGDALARIRQARGLTKCRRNRSEADGMIAILQAADADLSLVTSTRAICRFDRAREAALRLPAGSRRTALLQAIDGDELAEEVARTLFAEGRALAGRKAHEEARSRFNAARERTPCPAMRREIEAHLSRLPAPGKPQGPDIKPSPLALAVCGDTLKGSRPEMLDKNRFKCVCKPPLVPNRAGNACGCRGSDKRWDGRRCVSLAARDPVGTGGSPGPGANPLIDLLGNILGGGSGTTGGQVGTLPGAGGSSGSGGGAPSECQRILRDFEATLAAEQRAGRPQSSAEDERRGKALYQKILGFCSRADRARCDFGSRRANDKFYGTCRNLRQGRLY